VTSTNKLLVSLDSGYGDSTKFNRDLDRLMCRPMTPSARSGHWPICCRAIPNH
jgi:hypothetical protein